MNEPTENENSEEVFPRLKIFDGGLVNFIQSMQGRRSKDEGWKRSWRKRSGLGGRGYTKAIKNKDKSKIRRKMAKQSRRKNRRAK